MRMIDRDEELLAICGGISLSSSFLNAVSNTAKIILEIGRSVGSAIRRSISGKTCPL